MAADLSKTYAVTLVATMLAGRILLFAATKPQLNALIYPLALGAASSFASIIGTFFGSAKEGGKIMNACTRASSCPASSRRLPSTSSLTKPLNGRPRPTARLRLRPASGLVDGALIVITDYSHRHRIPGTVQRVAAASQTGHATNIMRDSAYRVEIGRALPVLAGLHRDLGLPTSWAKPTNQHRPGMAVAIAASPQCCR